MIYQKILYKNFIAWKILAKNRKMDQNIQKFYVITSSRISQETTNLCYQTLQKTSQSSVSDMIQKRTEILKFRLNSAGFTLITHNKIFFVSVVKNNNHILFMFEF